MRWYSSSPSISVDQTADPSPDIARERDRHGVIQSDDRRGIAGYERLVQEDDLLSRATLGVRSRDRRLELVRPRPPQRNGPLEHAQPSSIRRRSQSDAVLILEQHDLAVGADTRARRESCSSMSASSPSTSGSSGMSTASSFAEPDRLVAEVGADGSHRPSPRSPR